MARLATETIVSQSNRPLRISIRFGFGLAAAAFLYGLFLAIRYFTYAVPVQGWTSVMVSLFFLFGVLFCNIGILGLYLGKVFDESKGRPLYVIRDRLNIEDSPHAHLSHNGKDGPHRSEESRVEQSHA